MMDLKYPIRVRAEIPVVRMGYERVGRLVAALKESSTSVQWGLDMATDGVDRAAQMPCVKDRLIAIDRLLCASLDLTELKLPVLTKTPQQVYDESVEYAMGVAVRPFSNWMDAKFLMPADRYVDIYLPELDPEHRKNGHVENEEGSRTYQLAVKLTSRVKQHAYAEPKYLESLMHTGYEESISLMKTLVFDPKSLPETFHHFMKKLEDNGTRPDDQLLLVEMGCTRLRNCASSQAKIIEELIKCYVELIARYKNEMKTNVSTRLRNCASSVAKIIKELIKCYVELIARYKNEMKTNCFMDTFSSESYEENEHETFETPL